MVKRGLKNLFSVTIMSCCGGKRKKKSEEKKAEGAKK